MADLDSLRAQLHAGRILHFGEQVRLDGSALSVRDAQIALNTIQPIRLDESGDLIITHIGAREVLLTLPAADLEEADALVELVNGLVAEVPYLERRSVSGWPPGSVGDVSARIGYDIRDLWMAGYSAAEIDSVVYGERTVEDLLKRRPGDRPARYREPRE